MSSRFWSRRCDPTTSLRRENDPPDHFLILLIWKTSAATRLPPSAPLSGPPGQGCSSFPHTRPTLASLKTVHRTVFLTLLTHRTSLCQAQTSPAQGRRTQQRNRLAQDRHTPGSVHTARMRKLSQKLRLWFYLNPSRSNHGNVSKTASDSLLGPGNPGPPSSTARRCCIEADWSGFPLSP